MNFLEDWEMIKMKMSKMLIKNDSRMMMISELPTADAHPGIARSVENFIKMMVASAATEISIETMDVMSKRMAIISVNTAIAPNP